MGQIKVFQLDIADVVVVRNIAVIRRVIPHFHLHRLSEGVLLVEEHLQGSLHLAPGPCTLMVSSQKGDQHIGIVADTVQIIAVLVIAGMIAGIVVHFVLQSGLQCGIVGLRSQHIRILAGKRAAGPTAQNSLGQYGTGGHHVQKHHQNEKQADDNEKAPLMPHNKFSGPFASIRSPSQGVGYPLCHGGCGPGRALRCLPGTLCGGVLVFDGLFLLPA